MAKIKRLTYIHYCIPARTHCTAQGTILSYFLISYEGKESRGIYTYVSESLCCTPETNKSLSTTLKIKLNQTIKLSMI